MSAAPKSPRAAILPIAQRLLDALRPFCDRIEIAGSLRREVPQVGDIELVAIPIRPADLFNHPVKGPTPLDRFLDDHRITFTKRGDRYQQFTYGRHTVDLFLPTAATWGSVYTIRTGSWEFSHWLVTAQAAGGACPNEVQFRDGRLHAHGRLLSTAEETDVFAALGLVYIAPPLRAGAMPDAPRIDPIWNYE